jgi:hypothetical protein
VRDIVAEPTSLPDLLQVLSLNGWEELTPARRIIFRIRSAFTWPARSVVPGVAFVVGLSVGLAAVAVIYLLLFALARAAANGDRMNEEWLAKIRKTPEEQP